MFLTRWWIGRTEKRRGKNRKSGILVYFWNCRLSGIFEYFFSFFLFNFFFYFNSLFFFFAWCVCFCWVIQFVKTKKNSTVMKYSTIDTSWAKLTFDVMCFVTALAEVENPYFRTVHSMCECKRYECVCVCMGIRCAISKAEHAWMSLWHVVTVRACVCCVCSTNAVVCSGAWVMSMYASRRI